MTNPETHLVLAVRNGVAELAAAPFLSWHDAQNKWQLLDEARRAQGTPVSELYHSVRSASDPRYAHLLPRLYPTREAAAKALARRVAPGAKSGRQRRALNGALLGHFADGWWRTATTAVQLGYLGVLPDGRAYLTTLASTLAA